MKYLLFFMMFFMSVPAWAACTKLDSDGIEGEIIYNRQWKVMQFCDGTNWISMGASNVIATKGGVGEVQFNNGSGSLDADTNFRWDSTQQRLYIKKLSINAATPDTLSALYLIGRPAILQANSGNSTTGYTGITLRNKAGKSIFHIQTEWGTIDRNIEFITDANDNGATQNRRLVIQRSTGNIGIGRTDPIATLDVNGWVRLAVNSAAPATCDANSLGAIALTATAQMCVCDDSATWRFVNTTTACTW